MAAQECSNFDEGYCFPRDKRCAVICDNRICCRFFWEIVLPQDKELESLTNGSKGLDSDPARRRICASCGRAFIRENNRQTYCSSCSLTRRLEKERQRKRDARREKRGQSAFRTEDNDVLEG